MLNRVNKLKSIAGGVFFLLMAVGLVAGYFLTQQSQDIRQQASGGPYEASPNPSLNPSPSPNLSPSPSPPCEDAWCRGAYAASPSPSLTPSPTPQTSLTPLASPSPSPPCEDAWCRVGGLLPTPSPSLRPTPTPNTITQSDCDRCLATNTPSECRSACSNIGETYNATPTCTPGCLTSNTLRTCSNTGIPGSITCSAGCDEQTKSCKLAPVVSPNLTSGYIPITRPIPSPSPTLIATAMIPTPTPNTITQSDCDRCLAANTPSECRSACSNIGETYNATPTCTPGCLTSNTLRTCSNTGIPGSITCSAGCDDSTKSCKSTLLAMGGGCTTDSECSSGKCQKVEFSAFSDISGKRCIDPKDAGVIATYNFINAISFGAAGNYVKANMDIAEENPQATYWEKVLDQRNLAASAQLGVILSTEGVAIAMGGHAIIGGVAAGSAALGTGVAAGSAALTAVGTALPGLAFAGSTISLGQNYSGAIGDCSTDKNSPECKAALVNAGLATINFATAGMSSKAQGAMQAAKITGFGIQRATQQMTIARAANALATIPNLAVQAPAAIQVCRENPFSTACLIQGGSTAMMAAGGLSDAIFTGKTALSSIADKLLGGVSSYGPPSGVALIGDLHSDLAATKQLFWEQGIIDEYGRPTNQKFITVGDYYGKGTAQQGYNPGMSVFDYVEDIANRGNANNKLLAGNWEPRYAQAVVSYNNLPAGDIAEAARIANIADAAARKAALQALPEGDLKILATLLSKTASLEEIATLASNPEQFAKQLSSLDYITKPSSGAIAQHIDTPDLARLSLSPEDLIALKQQNPTLYNQIQTIIDPANTRALNPQQLNFISEAQKNLGLSSDQIINNINTNAKNAVTDALLGTPHSNSTITLKTLDSIMNQELSFYSSDRSDLLKIYANQLGIDTILHGHTPVSAITGYQKDILDLALKQDLITNQYTGSYYDPASQITLLNIDANNASGMRTGGQFFPTSYGIMQTPTDFEYVSRTLTPAQLPTTPLIPTAFNTPLIPSSAFWYFVQTNTVATP